MKEVSRNNVVRYMVVNQFLKNHPDYYEEFEIERIKHHALHDDEATAYTRDIMREIYDELGMIPDEENIYIAFQQELEKQFGIEGKRILEVGGGILPRLGKRIELAQTKGTITIYDPRVGKDIPSSERLILKREKFTRKTPVEDADLIIGLMPCEGAEPLIEQATSHKKDFMLWFCEGGPHGDCYDFYEDEFEWLNSMRYLAESGIRDNRLGKLMIKKLDHYSNYPIIYNQR